MEVTYDVVIVGGSLGGVAAAMSAASLGATVCLLEASEWLGGQYTAQGVTKPDENRYVETVGSTASYQAFRHAVRLYYRNNYRLSASGAQQPAFNPGGSYPGFSLDPRIGHIVLLQLLTSQPGVHVRLNASVTAVTMNGDSVASLTAEDPVAGEVTYYASYFLDATDLGDLLPLCGARDVDWVLGAEGRDETGEPNAPDVARPDWIQPITFPFALERRPRGEDHTITPPDNYEQLKADQQYSIDDGYIHSMFKPGQDMWSYRQFIRASNFADPALPYDLTMINCAGNDYLGGAVPTGSAEGDAQVLAAARVASLGYCYWIQTECPRDEDPNQRGYPELKLRTDVFGTPDGTSAQPYIRESRRIRAIGTVRQQDVDANYQAGPRARLFGDSCGIGLYGGLDIHANPSVGMPQSFAPALPFQIPLSTLVPVRWRNLLPGCKNLGVTHITNGAYRLHPVEWNIGEAAGALAAFCIAQSTSPSDVATDASLLRAYQHKLLDAGVPLFWWTDVPLDSPYFSAVQLLGVRGLVSGYGDMTFRATDQLTDEEKQDIEAAAGQTLQWPPGPLTRGGAALWLAQQLNL